MKNKIIKLLGGFTPEELDAINREHSNKVTKSTRILRDWRRGMPMLCKDYSGVKKSDNQIQKVINSLPINK